MKLSAMLVLDAWTKLTTTETSKRTSHPKRVQEQRFERVLVGELTVVVKHCVAAGVGVRGVDPDGPDALRGMCQRARLQLLLALQSGRWRGERHWDLLEGACG